MAWESLCGEKMAQKQIRVVVEDFLTDLESLSEKPLAGSFANEELIYNRRFSAYVRGCLTILDEFVHHEQFDSLVSDAVDEFERASGQLKRAQRNLHSMQNLDVAALGDAANSFQKVIRCCASACRAEINHSLRRRSLEN